MNLVIARIVGVVLVITGAIGILFSAFLLFNMWSFKADLTTGLTRDIGLVSDALVTTSEGLTVTEESLNSTQSSLIALQSTLSETSTTLENTQPLVKSLVSLLQEDLPATVDTAQTSLASAEESAQVIDSVLRALVSIPFVSNDIYNPDVPLHEALRNVSASLDPLPDAFATMESSLSSSTRNLETMQADIDIMAADLTRINASLEDAHLVIRDYQMQVSLLHARISGVRENLPERLNSVFLIAAFILIWFIVAQLGLIAQGLELLGRKRVVVVEEH